MVIYKFYFSQWKKVLLSDGSTWNFYDPLFSPSSPNWRSVLFCFQRAHFNLVAGKAHMSQIKVLLDSDV